MNDQITSEEIKKLMRAHGWTIRNLATTYGITMKRVREVRNQGVHGRVPTLEWMRMITGVWIDL